MRLLFAVVLFAFCFDTADGQISNYTEPVIYGRTGVTSFNMPDGSSLASPTISISDDRAVALDVNFVGGSGDAGLFFATNNDGKIIGDIVVLANDIILGDPTQDGTGRAVFTVGFGGDILLYDDATGEANDLNFPLGVTSTSGLTLDWSDRIGGRLGFSGVGDVYGFFNAQNSGFPTIEVYAADSDSDASSPFMFLFSPDMSRVPADTMPRMAGKVSTNAGFDFEEIRIFEADGSTQLIAVETETDSASQFSEFVTNSITISDDGSKVAFQANDTEGVSGIYLYDDDSQSITQIASVNDLIVGSIDFFSPDVNNDGVVVFRGDNESGLSSVFVGDGDNLIRVGGEGDIVQTDIGQRQLGRSDGDFSQSGAPRINNNGDVGWIFQYHDPTNANSIADGSLVMVSVLPSCIIGDVNQDIVVDLLDVAPFVDAISVGTFSCEADTNQDGVVDLLDVAAFIDLLTAM